MFARASLSTKSSAWTGPRRGWNAWTRPKP